MFKGASLVVLGVISTFAVACSSGASHANSDEAEVKAKEPRAHFVCREYDRGTSKMKQRTVVLNQTDDQGLKEGKKLAYSAELYEGAEVMAKKEVTGHAETEDVMFNFTSTDGSLKFGMYFDELEESSLTLDGKDAGDFACSRADYVCADYDRSTDKLGESTVTLSNRGKGDVREGKPHPFAIEIYDGPKAWDAQTADGTVETEDVSWGFTSKDGKIGFHIYLDEMNESGLTIEGKDRGDYICR